MLRVSESEWRVQEASTRLRVGVDIGGTFTDLLVYDPETEQFHIGKTLTTPNDPGRAVVDGLATLLGDVGLAPRAVQGIVHGTTLVTNAIIERKGARTALITTRGFRDAIEIAREHRYDLYDIFLEMPKPLVPRHLRLELDERVLADGSAITPVRAEEVRDIAKTLTAEGIEAVAVALIHAWRNPAHEQDVARLLAEYAPDLTISLSSEVVPEIREYERTSTTIANAYVRPVIARYLANLQVALRAMGVRGSLFIMISSGGICTVETAQNYPIRLIESGPAAGALAASEYGRRTSRPNLLSFDMGGTTAKACIIDSGQPLTTSDFEVARVYRFKKGSGLPIKVPVIDMIEIGAGGGSIARVDQMGLLKVGPDSAGSVPGPACYGRGGLAPTVTDADVLLGYLDPDYFLGGTMRLDLEAARRAIEQEVGAPLGLDTLHAAWGIHQVVNENMANAARIHAIERGKDPRALPVFAFGGAGPVHAYRIANILSAPQVLVPPGAGVASTIGFLGAPLAFDFVRSYYGRLDALNWDHINGLFNDMEQEGRRILRDAGVDDSDMTIERTVDLRFVGQGHEVFVSLPHGHLNADDTDDILKRFKQAYIALYERVPEGNPAEALSWRLAISAPRPVLPLHQLARHGGVSANVESALKGRRAIYLPERDAMVPVPVYDRYRLGTGAAFHGPAVVEERESTVIVGADAAVHVDDLACLVIDLPHVRITT